MTVPANKNNLNHCSKAAPWLVLSAAVLWGMIGIFTRYLNFKGFNAIQLTTSRCTITAVFLLIYLLATDYKKLKINVNDIWYFIGMGICSIIFFNICYFTTIRLSTLAVASVLLYTAPYFTLIFSFCFFHEPLTLQKIEAVMLSFIGCLLITGILEYGSISVSFPALLSGLGAGIGYSLFSIFGRIALKKYHPITVNFYTFMIAAFSILPFSNPPQMVNLMEGESKVVLNIILLGIISTALPFILYTKGLKYLGAGKASIMAFVEPLAASVIGIVIFGELLSFKGVLGMFFILVSIFLLNKNFY